MNVKRYKSVVVVVFLLFIISAFFSYLAALRDNITIMFGFGMCTLCSLLILIYLIGNSDALVTKE